MKALFIERGYLKVNACDCRQGSLFYKVLVTTSLPPLFLLRSNPYWLGNSKCQLIPFWLAHFFYMRGGLWPYRSLWVICFMVYYSLFVRSFVKFLRGTWGGIAASVTVLRGTLHPRGFTVVRHSQHYSKICVFPHPGASGPHLSLSANFILYFPIIILLNHRDRTHGQKELHWGCEEWPVIYHGVEGGKGKREAYKRTFIC